MAALCWPLLADGEFLVRDMVVLHHPALTHAALGFGDLAARAAPQDAVLAVLGMVVPASWVVRVFLIACAATAAVGGAWLARVINPQARAWSLAAAMTVSVWNPFTVERLLQGQWSLVAAAWVLPALVAAGLAGRPRIAVPAVLAASLTPTGGLVALVVSLSTSRGPRRWLAPTVAGLACLPWLVPGVLAGSTAGAGSVAAFAPRAEAYAGTAGTLVGLGGIWNAEAVPASREAGFAVAGVVLFAVLLTAWRRVPPVLLLLAGAGLGVAMLTWLLPGVVSWAVETIPGAGLVRDGQKFVMLALPAYAALAGAQRPLPAALVVAVALVQVPDAPVALREIAPVQLDTADLQRVADRADGRDVFFPDRSSLVRRGDGVVAVDPATKMMNVVESGALTVDGVEVDAPADRWVAAQHAWTARDLDELAELGVGLVVTGDGEVIDTTAPARPLPALGVGLLVVWFLLPSALLLPSRGRRQDR